MGCVSALSCPGHIKLISRVKMKSFGALIISSLLGLASAQVEYPIAADVTAISYMDGDASLTGHLSAPEGEGPFPAVIIIPDWDGVNEYEHVRATMVSDDWGFVGFAADIYGSDLQTVSNITLRRELATFYRSNPDVFSSRIAAAINYVKSLDNVDTDNVALFGYCFGGTGVLQYGLLGNNEVNSIVSFHGGLSFLPEVPETFGPKLLLLSGGDDDTSTEIMDLEMTFDTAEASWEITRYSGIQHAFTVFTDDRYNAWADMRSWESAYHFLQESFGITSFSSAQPTAITTVEVEYIDETDGKSLKGHLAMPSAGWKRPLPAVVIFPDWDGANTYEQERATALAELGYVAMVADIFGADKQFVEEVSERVELITQYLSDPDLYVSRMQAAVDQIKMLADDVNMDEIAVIGYCFGGTGTTVYSFAEGAEAKVAVAFHGSYGNGLPVVNADPIVPYQLVLSGGDDDLHGNQTIMEDAFNSGNAEWEITRYSGVDHGYTAFASGAYNLVADARSWESMLTSFQELLAVPERANIAGTAVAAGSFNTLVASLDAADLVGAVSDETASLTVFAPTDDAFAALPDGLVSCLLLEANQGVLSDILLYHVLGSMVMSTDLMNGMTAETLQGESVTVDLSAGVMINQANVVAADIMTSNGVIHAIDAVITPPSIDVAGFLSTCPTEEGSSASSASILAAAVVGAMVMAL